MKYKNCILALLFLIPALTTFGWGDKGHKTIAAFGIKMLPEEMKFPEKIGAQIIEHSVDPDDRKRDDRNEGPKHFIDIDFYKEYMDGNIITSIDTLKKSYNDKTITREGILPWATEFTYFKLVAAFKSRDNKSVILYASDLAHYVGDGHQPLHATVNYNGQLTDQKGVHARYEIDMVDDNLANINAKFEKETPYYIKDLAGYIFDYIMESNSYVEMLLSADKYCTEKTGGKFDKEYYRLLWLKTKYITINEFNRAGWSLANLIYSAWIDAGKPLVEE